MNRAAGQEPKTFFDQRMSVVLQSDFVGGQAVVFSARCPNKETANEDALAIIPVDENSGVLAVADGMGGYAAGEAAAKAAIQEVVSAIHEAIDSGVVIRSAIVDGFERANEKVRALGTGGGTTLSVLEIHNGSARPYHAGDSMILIVGSKGKVKLQSTMHSPVGFGVEAGFLDDDEAMHYEDRHVVLNAIGSESMRIEIGSPVKIAKRDTVLIASDGLSDNLRIEEIIERIRKGSLVKSVEGLVGRCTERMSSNEPTAKPDDLSLVVFRRS